METSETEQVDEQCTTEDQISDISNEIQISHQETTGYDSRASGDSLAVSLENLKFDARKESQCAASNQDTREKKFEYGDDSSSSTNTKSNTSNIRREKKTAESGDDSSTSSHTKFSVLDMEYKFGDIHVQLQEPTKRAMYADIDSGYSAATVENILEEMAKFFCSDPVFFNKTRCDLLRFWRLKESDTKSFGALFLNADIPQIRLLEQATGSQYYGLPKIVGGSDTHMYQRNVLEVYLQELQNVKRRCALQKLVRSEEVNKFERLGVHDRLNTLLMYIFQSLYEVNLRFDGCNTILYSSKYGSYPIETRPDLVLRDDSESRPLISFEICGVMGTKYVPKTGRSKSGKASSSSSDTTQDEYRSHLRQRFHRNKPIYLTQRKARKLPDSLQQIQFSPGQTEYIRKKLYGQTIQHLLGCISDVFDTTPSESSITESGRSPTESWGFFILHEIAIPVKIQCAREYVELFLGNKEKVVISDYNEVFHIPPLFSVMNWHLDLSKQACRRALSCFLKFHHQSFAINVKKESGSL